MSDKIISVAVSGYFDPIHVGHLDYLELAKELGDKLIVIVNNNHQCKLKKGKPFMDESDRMRILESLSVVDEVFLSIDSDRSVCKSLEEIKPDIFANGGDRATSEVPESVVCKKYGIEIKYVKAKKPLGTAGQLKSAQRYLKDNFLCLYSDSLFNFKIKNAIKFHKKNNPLVTMVVCNYETRLKYGMIELNKDKSIAEWKEKPVIRGMINTGCFIMNYKFLKYIPKNKTYEMDQAFKNIQKENHNILGFPVKGDMIDLGDKTEYEKIFKKYNTSGKK